MTYPLTVRSLAPPPHSTHTQAAIELAGMAAGSETDAAAGLLPTSTSLYFVPDTAFQGALALRIATALAPASAPAVDVGTTAASQGTPPGTASESPPRRGLSGGGSMEAASLVQSLLRVASGAFDACLEGRPNLPICRLGAARAAARLAAEAAAAAGKGHAAGGAPLAETDGKTNAVGAAAKIAQHHYKALMRTWGEFKGQPARRYCEEAWNEAQQQLGAVLTA